MPDTKNKSAKGNPASKRMSNPERKHRCAAAHSRSAVVKRERADAQIRRAGANRSRIEMGELTPWEQAKANRRARRAEDPKVQARAQHHRIQNNLQKIKEQETKEKATVAMENAAKLSAAAEKVRHG
jgi:hypothetical protein